ncbi:MAG: hypothetical protein J6C49_07275 [Elusimicrobiaceae bacterium]|nr:hypothetical protein [Elusimicrobiaceae bacterium]
MIVVVLIVGWIVFIIIRKNRKANTIINHGKISDCSHVFSNNEAKTLGTIKYTGLQAIIENGVIYNNEYDIEDTLSDDLTAEEITTAQATIEANIPHIREVVEKGIELTEKINKISAQIETLTVQAEFSILKTVLRIVRISFFVMLFGGIWTAVIIAKLCNSPHGDIIFLVVCSLILLFIISANIFKAWKQYLHSKKAKSELNTLEQELITVNEEKNKLLHTIRAHSVQEAITGAIQLGKLADLLQKLYLIITDTQNSQTERLLAIENFFYLLHKKKIDRELVNEAKKTTSFAAKHAFYAQQQASLTQQQLTQQQESARQQADLAQKLIAQQQENARNQTRELEKQTEIIKEKARLDESRQKDGQPWRF